MNRCEALVRVERIRKKFSDQFFRVGIFQVNQMTGAIECETILCE